MDLQLSGAKPRTQDAYLREVENLAKYFKRSPAELGEAELKEYLLYLMKERHLSEGTFRFYVAGLKFFYRTTLKREWPVEKISIRGARGSFLWSWTLRRRSPSFRSPETSSTRRC